MNWVVCNRCLKKEAKCEKPFHLMQCLHMFCNQCIATAKRQCPQCKKCNVKSVCLDEHVDDQVKELFEPLGKKLEFITMINEFTNTITPPLLKGMDIIEKKSIQLQKMDELLVEDIKKLQRKCIEAAETYNALKRLDPKEVVRKAYLQYATNRGLINVQVPVKNEGCNKSGLLPSGLSQSNSSNPPPSILSNHSRRGYCSSGEQKRVSFRDDVRKEATCSRLGIAMDWSDLEHRQKEKSQYNFGYKDTTMTPGTSTHMQTPDDLLFPRPRITKVPKSRHSVSSSGQSSKSSNASYC